MGIFMGICTYNRSKIKELVKTDSRDVKDLKDKKKRPLSPLGPFCHLSVLRVVGNSRVKVVPTPTSD